MDISNELISVYLGGLGHLAKFGKIRFLIETQFADELSRRDSRWALFVGCRETRLNYGISKSYIVGGALLSIMFNGRELKRLLRLRKM